MQQGLHQPEVAPARAVSPSVRRAQAADVAALTRLVNACYAIEAFFVDGDRTTEDEVAALMRAGHFLVLDRGGPAAAGDRLAAAVYVRITDDRADLGMLSVAPDLRGLGLGRRLVAVAEALGAALGCVAIDLQIVNLREELGPWYRRQGYVEVGTAPFDAQTGKAPRRPCHFVRMRKPLA